MSKKYNLFKVDGWQGLTDRFCEGCHWNLPKNKKEVEVNNLW